MRRLGREQKVLEHSLRRQSDRLYRRGPVGAAGAADGERRCGIILLMRSARRLRLGHGRWMASSASRLLTRTRRTPGRTTVARRLGCSSLRRQTWPRRRNGPQSRIYPPLFPPNEPPAVVATVVPPKAIDWERTERMVVGDPLPRGSHEPSTIRIVAVSTVFRSCGIRWTAPSARLFSFTNY